MKTDWKGYAIYIGLGVITAIVLNFLLGAVLGTNLPVVAVVSDSMTHDSVTGKFHYAFLNENFGYTEEEIGNWPINSGFLKGDVLLIQGVDKDELEVGDVIVYDIGQQVPIVHRVVKIEGDVIWTKGDHNPSVDPWTPREVYGKAVSVIPFLGWPKLFLTQMLGVF